MSTVPGSLSITETGNYSSTINLDNFKIWTRTLEISLKVFFAQITLIFTINGNNERCNWAKFEHPETGAVKSGSEIRASVRLSERPWHWTEPSDKLISKGECCAIRLFCKSKQANKRLTVKAMGQMINENDSRRSRLPVSEAVSWLMTFRDR